MGNAAIAIFWLLVLGVVAWFIRRIPQLDSIFKYGIIAILALIAIAIVFQLIFGVNVLHSLRV